MSKKRERSLHAVTVTKWCVGVGLDNFRFDTFDFTLRIPWFCAGGEYDSAKIAIWVRAPAAKSQLNYSRVFWNLMVIHFVRRNKWKYM